MVVVPYVQFPSHDRGVDFRSSAVSDNDALGAQGDFSLNTGANSFTTQSQGGYNIPNSAGNWTYGTTTTGQGYDVKFFGDAASSYLQWDASVDDLILAGEGRVIVPDGQLVLGSTAVTSTAAELNILDGVTSTTAELNILDGVTSTTAELNILDGVTSTTAELNILDGVTSTAAELNLL